MAKIYTSLDQLMGHTPLLSLNYENLAARVKDLSDSDLDEVQKMIDRIRKGGK